MMKQIILSPQDLREFGDIHPVLDEIFQAMLNFWPSETVRITSIYRSPEQDRIIKGQTEAAYKRGIHTVGPPYRALDISVLTIGPGWQRAVEKISDKLNEMWQYDYERTEKVVCYAKPHGTGPHIHLQVHPNTAREFA